MFNNNSYISTFSILFWALYLIVFKDILWGATGGRSKIE